MKHDPVERSDTALWRYSVLGPLVSARLDHGDRAAHLRQIAARTHIAPDGRTVRLSARTVEAWFYAWRSGGLTALEPTVRGDRGRSHIRPELQKRLEILKRENPRRSIRRLIRILEYSGEADRGELSRSSVQRFLASGGISGRGAGAEADRQRLPFRHREPGELWMGDVLHGPRVLAGGRIRKSYLIAFIDSATRFVPAAEFRLSEGAADHEYALKQAILKHGCPRVLYLDNGAAQISRSLKLICADLSIQILHAEAYTPQSKGAIERFNRTWRDGVESELPVDPLPLDELRSLTWSWLAVEYNGAEHSGTHRVPLDHWLEGTSLLRPVPPGIDIDEVFLHREQRLVRRDGTVRFRSHFFEIRGARPGEKVELRFDPFAPAAHPRVFRDGRFLSDAAPVDLERNAYRRRHRPPRLSLAAEEASGLDPLDQIAQEHLRRVRQPPRAADISTPPPDTIDPHTDTDDDNDSTSEVSHV